MGNYSFPHIKDTVFTLQNLFPTLTSSGVYFSFIYNYFLKLIDLIFGMSMFASANINKYYVYNGGYNNAVEIHFLMEFS